MAVCAICMDSIDDKICDEYRGKLSCDHEFHPMCILKWFKKNTSCPTCRAEHTEKAIASEEVTTDMDVDSNVVMDAILNEIRSQTPPVDSLDFYRAAPTSFFDSFFRSVRPTNRPRPVPFSSPLNRRPQLQTLIDGAIDENSSPNMFLQSLYLRHPL
jgi:hypothetical protein